ncbi:MAG: hypothetical protein ACI4JW_07260 [Oscillospiraceae bacterium]
MKKEKIIPAFFTSFLCLSMAGIAAYAEIESIDMQDAGYGINGGRSFTADGITAYESTLGDLSDKYDTIDFTISADDLGGRSDLVFQVYVAADNWTVWANGNETPAIEAAGTDYSFSLNVDEIAETYGSDKVICDMGFQIMSSTPGAVNVTYSYNFSAGEDSTVDESDNEAVAEGTSEAVPDNNETAADIAETPNEAPAADNTQSEIPKTGNIPVSVIAVSAVLSAAAVILNRKKNI